MINEDILKQIEQTDRFIGRELQEDPELLVNVKHCIVERIQGYDFGGKKGCYAIVRQEYANGLGGPLVVMTTEPRLQGLLETAMGGDVLEELNDDQQLERSIPYTRDIYLRLLGVCGRVIVTSFALGARSIG